MAEYQNDLKISKNIIFKKENEAEYKNPIIGGYAPDPSICHGEDGYYLVNSSFTSFPGIPVYFSKNMIEWELVSYAASSDKINLGDNYTNGGLWAPTIRYIRSKKTYYMIVKNMNDKRTLITSADNPKMSIWSDPIYISDIQGNILTDLGIDPDLFEDEDGRIYYSDGDRQIAEINLDNGRIKHLYYNWSGVVDVYTEGPHIYRIGEYYYCIYAEGGTGLDHMTMIARKPIKQGLINTADNRQDAQIGWEIAPIYTGYEVIQRFLKQTGQNGRSVLEREVKQGNVSATTITPHNPILHNPCENEINTCGHADLVKDENGNWWIVFLGRRTKKGPDLARETFLAPVEWQEGWPIINKGKSITTNMKGPKIETDWRPNEKPVFFDFLVRHLNLHFNFIRNIRKDNFSLSVNPGFLTLYTISDSIDGKDLPKGENNGQHPAWIGIRQTEKNAAVSTAVEFYPSNDTDVAGLTMYNTSDNMAGPYNIEFIIMKNGNGRKLAVDIGKNQIQAQVSIPDRGIIYLKMEISSKDQGNADITMSYSFNNKNWTNVITLDVFEAINYVQYTGIYLGMYASGRGKNTRIPAKFKFFTYRSCDVRTKEVSFKKTNSKIILNRTDSICINPHMIAPDLTNKKLHYILISGEDIISVNPKGKITANKKGTAVLKVISDYDQSKSMEYKITVK